LIEISHLGKSWADGGDVLKDISLDIAEGDMYALVGRSGAGKSTLLRCINGLTGYQSGSVVVDGHEIKDMSYKDIRELRRQIGMVFQQFSLLERESVFNNVALPMTCWGYQREEIEKKVMSLLELVGLADRRDDRPRSLSGGQKQRVAIARALTMDPKILLCDEATSALDPKTTNSILDLLMKINRETGITIVIVTHQMEVVRKACQKACILERGVITDMGDVLDIFYKRPASLLRLLGEDQSQLPSEGVNLRVAYDATGDGAGFFDSFSRETGFVPAVVDGGIQNFRNKATGLFTLNVLEQDLDKAAGFLEGNALRWDRIDEEWLADSSCEDGEEE
jgi:D-methionine transport system ATP-binding protein